MMIFPVVIAVAALVTLGYLALWSSSHEKTSKEMAGFGKIMGMIVLVLAGLLLIVGITFSARCGMCPMCQMMSRMHHGGMMMGSGPCSEGKESCCKDTIKCQMMEWQKCNPKEMSECMKEMKGTEKQK